MPNRLWARASALVSAMWGVGTVLGPAAGGLFAQFGALRWAFGSVAVMAAVTAALVPAALSRTHAPGAAAGISQIWLLTLLAAAAMTVSVAAVQHVPLATALLLIAGVGLLGCFLLVDGRVRAAVLPHASFRPGPLKWMYAMAGLLMAATMADIYVPLYGQRLAHLAPVAAGFVGAVLSVGWSLSEIVSASVTRRRVAVWLVTAAPLVMAVGLAAAAWPGTAVWLVALFTAGAGVGLAWPHLSAWIMGAADDRAQAGAAINTVQLFAGAFGAALAGVFVDISGGGDLASARWLFVSFAVLAAAGGLLTPGCRSGSPTSGHR
ncbi:MAG TPA: MFS transporter [Mycobacterium sp.]|nr:MFS transporter [Mycobacterium sp.]